MDPIEQITRLLLPLLTGQPPENEQTPFAPPGGGTPTPPSFKGGGSPEGGGSGKPFDPGPNSELEPWKKGISDAAEISGLDPNLVGAQVWAESRGEPGTSTTNADGNTDSGLMQISQERWDSEICPNLSEEQRAKIREKTGKEAEQLDMTNPEEGIIGGSLEMKMKLDECGGDLNAALQYYQSGDKGGNPTYAKNVMQYMDELANGQKLSEDPFGSP